jgi:hypothetical protein
LALEDLDDEGTQTEQPESVELPSTENRPTDEVPSSAEETEDRSADEALRVSSIQRILDPGHQGELEDPELFRPRLPSYDEESSVAIQDSESVREEEVAVSERNESHATRSNRIDIVIVS